MSHFSVLVIGGNVEEQLQPYHEFECTGTDDQYIQEIDRTEEARNTFEKNTTTCVRNPDGELEDKWSKGGDARPEFYREPTPEETEKHGKIGDGVSCGKVYELPEGWSEVEVPTGTRKTFAEFCEDYYGYKIVPFGEQPNFTKANDGNNHKYGYTVVDEQGNVVKTIDRTNPNAKWDFHSVGGRWNGFFKLKPLAVGVLGKPGIQDMNDDYEPPFLDRGGAIMKGDIDIEGMRDEAAEKANESYDIFERVGKTATVDGVFSIGGIPRFLPWEQVQERNRTGKTDESGKPEVDWEAAREEYNAQPIVEALRKSRETVWFKPDEFLCTREEYVQRHRDTALSTFAVVKDGVWYERGSMGWFGVVSGEKDRNEWGSQFAALIDDLPDNALLTVVDCHI